MDGQSSAGDSDSDSEASFKNEIISDHDIPVDNEDYSMRENSEADGMSGYEGSVDEDDGGEVGQPVHEDVGSHLHRVGRVEVRLVEQDHKKMGTLTAEARAVLNKIFWHDTESGAVTVAVARIGKDVLLIQWAARKVASLTGRNIKVRYCGLPNDTRGRKIIVASWNALAVDEVYDAMTRNGIEPTAESSPTIDLHFL